MSKAIFDSIGQAIDHYKSEGYEPVGADGGPEVHMQIPGHSQAAAPGVVVWRDRSGQVVGEEY